MKTTDNNSLKTRLEEHRIGGHIVQLLLQQQGSNEVCIDARAVPISSETKINNSTTSPQLYSPISDSPHGMNTYPVSTSEQKDGPSSVPPVTALRQKLNALSEQKQEEPVNKHLGSSFDDYLKESGGVGLKYDGDKPPLAYIPKAALYAEGEAFAFGARKYEPFNYKNGIAITRTLSAAIRHILQFLDGEDLDVESGTNHLGCARANLAMALDTLANHPHFDDRFKGGK